MRYFVHIAYDGGNYHGWQFQINAISLQGEIESALQEVFKQKVAVSGCGRTDTGVHASQYFFHFNVEQEINFDLKFRLNKKLPSAIVVFDVLEVNPKQHARLDATSRTYDYYIHLDKDPFLNSYSSLCEVENLDVEAMEKAASILTNYTQFITFCKAPKLTNNTKCKVTFSKLMTDATGRRLRFTIAADRFLHGMIRIIVFYLLQIGNKKMTFSAFEELLKQELDVEDKHMAPANGLYLSKIEYPYLYLDSKSEINKMLDVGF